MRLELSCLFLPSFNEWRCMRCLSFCRLWKTQKHLCRSSVISFEVLPSSVPTLLYPTKPIPLPFSFFSPSPYFCLIFLFSPLFFLLFLSFLFLSFFPDPLSFFYLLSFLLFLLFFLLFWCVRVCVYPRMYVRAYLTISCVSANDNVKHTKSNIRYDNKID